MYVHFLSSHQDVVYYLVLNTLITVDVTVDGNFELEVINILSRKRKEMKATERNKKLNNCIGVQFIWSHIKCYLLALE